MRAAEKGGEKQLRNNSRLSEWGLIVMTPLLLTVGMVVLRRWRRSVTACPPPGFVVFREAKIVRRLQGAGLNISEGSILTHMSDIQAISLCSEHMWSYPDEMEGHRIAFQNRSYTRQRIGWKNLL